MKYKVYTAKMSELQKAQLNGCGWGFSPWSKAYANLRFISQENAIDAAADIFEMFNNDLYHLGYEFEIDSQSIQPHLEMIFAAGNAQRPVLPEGALLSFIKHDRTRQFQWVILCRVKGEIAGSAVITAGKNYPAKLPHLSTGIRITGTAAKLGGTGWCRTKS